MQRAAPWMLRLGALLLIAAPFLPQARVGERTLGSVSMTAALAGKLGGVERLAVATGLFLPVLAGLVLLAGASLPGGGPPALRLVGLALLLAVSFLLSTLGSLLLTDVATRSVAPSFPLTLALFAVPLALSGASLARWMQTGLDRSTGAFERAGLAVLLLLHGLLLADCGWGYLLLPGAAVPPGPPSLLAGAWAGPLGAALVIAGSLFLRLPARAAVDTAAASG